MSERRPPSRRELSTGDLAAQALVQFGGLVGQEIALARAELRAQGRQLGTGTVMLGGAGFLGVSAWLVLLAAAVAGIAVVLPVWAAALIVGGALALMGTAAAAVGGRRLSRAKPALPLTTQSIRQDLQQIGRGQDGGRKP